MWLGKYDVIDYNILTNTRIYPIMTEQQSTVKEL